MSWETGLARPEIVALSPYEPLACEPGFIRLHANESPWRPMGDLSEVGLNSYPEPQPRALLAHLARLYNVSPEGILIGRGSDELIDCTVRAFCRAGQDAVVVCPPTFGMYALAATLQGARVVPVPLVEPDGFALDESQLIECCSSAVKIVFLCSPNNPTGNLHDPISVLRIATTFSERVLVVVDEAYLEYSGAESLARHLSRYPNLIILRTLSKAHGLAGARCGALLASPVITTLIRKVMMPFPVPQLTQEAVLKALTPYALTITRQRIARICGERTRVSKRLDMLARVRRVWPSAANFLLTEFVDAPRALQDARTAGFLVRELPDSSGLSSALRITIGSENQNEQLLRAWA